MQFMTEPNGITKLLHDVLWSHLY